jgi:hypothetical protein
VVTNVPIISASAHEELPNTSTIIDHGDIIESQLLVKTNIDRTESTIQGEGKSLTTTPNVLFSDIEGTITSNVEQTRFDALIERITSDSSTVTNIREIGYRNEIQYYSGKDTMITIHEDTTTETLGIYLDHVNTPQVDHVANATFVYEIHESGSKIPTQVNGWHVYLTQEWYDTNDNGIEDQGDGVSRMNDTGVGLMYTETNEYMGAVFYNTSEYFDAQGNLVGESATSSFNPDVSAHQALDIYLEGLPLTGGYILSDELHSLL